jgi:hypothetical protein
MIGSVKLLLLGWLAKYATCDALGFAVPFEEDDKDPRIWFLDHNYYDSMLSMFKRINGMFFRNSHVFSELALSKLRLILLS